MDDRIKEKEGLKEDMEKKRLEKGAAKGRRTFLADIFQDMSFAGYLSLVMCILLCAFIAAASMELFLSFAGFVLGLGGMGYLVGRLLNRFFD